MNKSLLSLLMLTLLASAGNSSAAITADGQITALKISTNNSYHYTILLSNKGQTNLPAGDSINTFWYAWVPGDDYLPSAPTNIQSPAGWSASVTHGALPDGYAILWQNNTGSNTALAPGKSTNAFSFETTNPPLSVFGNSIFDTAVIPVGTSTLYSGAPFAGSSAVIVVKGVQAISFPTIASRIFSTNPFAITLPTASSALPVSLTLTPTNLATLVSNSLTMKGSGTLSLIASQAGNSNYLAATPVTNAFVIYPAVQPLSFPKLTNAAYGNAPLLIAATDFAGRPISYSVLSGPATIVSNTLSITGAGTVVLQASVPTNSIYPAETNTNSFSVAKGAQTITFPTIASRPFSTNPFTITLPTASSKLPVSLSVTPTNLATLVSNSLTMKGTGTITLIASQTGNSNYLAALSVTNSFLITAAVTNSNTLYSFGTGSNTFTLSFTSIGNPGNAPDNTTGYGAVPYSYQIGTYDISQNQVNAAMSNGVPGLQGYPGYTWTGDQPATGITWYQAAAFVNWLNTSHGYAPAYNLSYSASNGYTMSLWATNQAWTNGGLNLYRSKSCVYFLPSENEWYKAAYYNPKGTNYFLYPTGRNTASTPVASGTIAGTAVYNQTLAKGPASVYQAGGLSPYGTMGQGGNVWQLEESAFSGGNTDPNGDRVFRGGYWGGPYYGGASSIRNGGNPPGLENRTFGFRVARIP